MFEEKQAAAQIGNRSGDELDKAWKAWVRSEEMIRIVLGLYILDAELAGIFHHEPILRHNAKKLPVAASNDAFTASTASRWAAIVAEQPRPDLTSQNSLVNELTSPSYDSRGAIHVPQTSGRFAAYVILEGIGAAICEHKQQGGSDPDVLERFRDALNLWYVTHQRSETGHESDPLCLMVLWHLTFMSLFADFDLLERAIGRDGSEVARSNLVHVSDWASSIDAKRCVIHASLVQKQIETMRIGTEPAIHVPRALFLAAIAWYCYTRFGSDVGLAVSSKEPLDFPEIKLLGINASLHLFEANGFKTGKPSAIESSTLCGLTDLLQRIGHWEIARRFAAILGSLIHGETDEGLIL